MLFFYLYIENVAVLKWKKSSIFIIEFREDFFILTLWNPLLIGVSELCTNAYMNCAQFYFGFVYNSNPRLCTNEYCFYARKKGVNYFLFKKELFQFFCSFGYFLLDSLYQVGPNGSVEYEMLYFVRKMGGKYLTYLYIAFIYMLVCR